MQVKKSCQTALHITQQHAPCECCLNATLSYCCSIAKALEEAGLCNSSGDTQKEVMGLILAVMAEKCNDNSRLASKLSTQS